VGSLFIFLWHKRAGARKKGFILRGGGGGGGVLCLQTVCTKSVATGCATVISGVLLSGEAYHSSSSRAEVKNVWNLAFMSHT